MERLGVRIIVAVPVDKLESCTRGGHAQNHRGEIGDRIIVDGVSGAHRRDRDHGSGTERPGERNGIAGRTLRAGTRTAIIRNDPGGCHRAADDAQPVVAGGDIQGIGGRVHGHGGAGDIDDRSRKRIGEVDGLRREAGRGYELDRRRTGGNQRGHD